MSTVKSVSSYDMMSHHRDGIRMSLSECSIFPGLLLLVPALYYRVIPNLFPIQDS